MISRAQAETCVAAFNAGATLKAAAAAAGIGTISARRAIRGELPIQVAGHHGNLGRRLPHHPNARRAEAAAHVAPEQIALAAQAIRDAWSPAVAVARARAADRALLRLARAIVHANAPQPPGALARNAAEDARTLLPTPHARDEG